MLKRFAAILFVLALAGNVWAGLCDCFEGANHSESDCCKRDRSGNTSISKKPCCGSECGESAFVTVNSTLTDTAVKIPHQAGLLSINPFFFESLGISHPDGSRSAGPHIEYHPQFPRPPNLYIKHNSFLI